MSKFSLFQFARQIRCIFSNQPVRRKTRSHRHDLEYLEERCVPAAVIVTADPGLTTTESGGTAQFSIVLDQQPTKNVKIPIKSSDTTEGTVSAKFVIFTPGNWNQPQTVTVTGKDDTLTDGDQQYSIELNKVKGDKLYKKQDPADVSITNIDNEEPGILISGATNLQTTEGGGTATFNIRLQSRPTAPVTITFQSSNADEGTVTQSVSFTPGNWDQPKTVTITGVNDSVIDGDQAYQITVGAAQSSDSNYNGLTTELSPITVTNHDNDVASLVISPTSTLNIFEGGSQDVSVKLSAQPTSDVTVTIAETVGASQADVSTTTLTFTPENWIVSQKVTISGLLGDGSDNDASQAYAITLDTTSDDTHFNALPTRTVNANILDTDNQPHNLDGVYNGSYDGTVTVLGFPTNQSGNVQFTVVGNNVTVTEPADASGTITDGSGTFAPTSGPLVGGSFTGTFTENPDGTVTVAGTWTYSHNNNHGQGTWSATRPAPA